MRKALPILSLLSVGSVLTYACNSAEIGGGGTDPTDDGGGDPQVDMKTPLDPEMACGSVRAGATLSKQPVDVIFVIDNSQSMTAEITAVQNNINNSFAQIIKASGIDYRIIMITRHGSASASQSVCISAPLSSVASCTTPPAQPGFTPNFFHYSTEISSTDTFQKIINTYSVPDEFTKPAAGQGWSQWLRPNAYKTFIAITDDTIVEAPNTAAEFDRQLLAKSPTLWGTTQKRNYIYHAIAGVLENPAGPRIPYESTAPLVGTKCSSAQNTGTIHQNLAILTGGLRYPVCQTANYDAVFNKVAEGVISGSKIACDFAMPTPPPGKEFITETAQLEYIPSTGPTKIYTKVANLAACAPDSFYIENNRVNLCAVSCNEVQADPGAKIEFLLECRVIIG